MISQLSDRTGENDRVGQSKMMRAIVNGEDDYAVDLISRSGAVRILYEPILEIASFGA
jgi:hypothetical protein